MENRTGLFWRFIRAFIWGEDAPNKKGIPIEKIFSYFLFLPKNRTGSFPSPFIHGGEAMTKNQPVTAEEHHSLLEAKDRRKIRAGRFLCTAVGAFAFFDDPADPSSTARAALEDKR